MLELIDVDHVSKVRHHYSSPTRIKVVGTPKLVPVKGSESTSIMATLYKYPDMGWSFAMCETIDKLFFKSFIYYCIWYDIIFVRW